MAGIDLAKKLERLFRDTGQAHHQVFIETHGADPEWLLWQADCLNARLDDMLPNTFTKSELVYLHVLMDKKRANDAPKEQWPVFNARYLAQVYG